MNRHHELRSHAQTRSRRHGAILVLSAFLLVGILSFAAFTVDVGSITYSRAKLQAATDAAALAGVADMHIDKATADTTIYAVLAANGLPEPQTNPDIVVSIQYGEWDEDSRVFSVCDFEDAYCVHLDVTHKKLTSYFGKVLGHEKYETSAKSTAMSQASNPRDIAMVIDCSGSMAANMSNGQKRIDNTKAAALSLMENLGTDDRAGLSIYSWSDNTRNRYKKTASIEHMLSFDHAPVEATIGGMDHQHYTGGTNIGGGFRAGCEIFMNDPSPRDDEEDLEKILIMMTDGQTNMAEPYPDEDGLLPPPPYKKNKYESDTAVELWAAQVRSQGIKVYVVTVGASAYDPLMVNAASPPVDEDGDGENDEQYYFHVAEGSEDFEILKKVYQNIGRGKGGGKLVR